MLKGFKGFAISIIVLAVLVAIMSKGLPTTAPTGVAGNAPEAGAPNASPSPPMSESDLEAEGMPQPGASLSVDPSAPVPGAGEPMMTPQGIDPMSGSSSESGSEGETGTPDESASPEMAPPEEAPAESAQP